MPVRFAGNDLKMIIAKARGSNQTVSEWVRSASRVAIAQSEQLIEQSDKLLVQARELLDRGRRK